MLVCVCACACLRVCGRFINDSVGGIEIRAGDVNMAARVCVREHTAKGEGRDLQSKKPRQALHVISCQRVYIPAFSCVSVSACTSKVLKHICKCHQQSIYFYLCIRVRTYKHSECECVCI